MKKNTSVYFSLIISKLLRNISEVQKSRVRGTDFGAQRRVNGDHVPRVFCERDALVLIIN